MKIAIICSSFFPVIDGVTIAVFNRVKYLSKLGHQVILFCPDYSAIAHIYPDWKDYTGEIFAGVKVISLPSTKSIALDFERDVTIKSYSIVEEELTEFQPDIIHVDEAERLGVCFLKLPGVKFAKQNNIPCVAWFHTNYIDYIDDYFKLAFGINRLVKKAFQLIFSKIYNSYDLTLVSSKITQQKLKQIGIKNTRYADLLGCDLERFNNVRSDNSWLTKQYNLPALKHKVKLIFLGRLTPDKGWDFTLNSLAKLPNSTLNKIAIIIAGDGTLRTQIDRTLKPLVPDTYFLGRIPPQDIADLLINGDIFITNSEKETRGLTVIEAAAAGIPALAPDAGGVVDTIIDGETGFLYQPQNTADFLEKLKILIEDKLLCNLMGKNAKAVAQKWSWQQATDNSIDVWLQEITAKKSIYDRSKQ